MKAALEICLTSDVTRAHKVEGRVHSKFRRTINLICGQRLITVHTPDIPGVPDDIVVTAADFDEFMSLPQGACVTFEGGRVWIHDGHKRIDLHGASERRAGIDQMRGPAKEMLQPVLARFAGRSGFARMAQAQRTHTREELKRLCKAQEQKDVLKALVAVCGCGFGLTPSSDDAAVGIMAAACAGLLGEFSMPDPQILWIALSGRTTDVSRKYLCCAAEKRFSQPLRRLLNAVPGENLQALAERVAQVGATSGADTLAGLLLALTV